MGLIHAKVKETNRMRVKPRIFQRERERETHQSMLQTISTKSLSYQKKGSQCKSTTLQLTCPCQKKKKKKMVNNTHACHL